jgi:RNA polymerase sigma-70 factor (family 1)
MNQTLDTNVFYAFKEGDPAAFREVFNAYYRHLYYFTKKLIDNKEEAEEIALNSFQKLFERCGRIDAVEGIKAFLFVTARNNSIDYLRSSKLQKTKQRDFAASIQNDTFLEFEYEIRDELVEMVRNAINNLPSECSKVFKMLFYDELTPAEVAEVLKISVSTVYNQKSRALQALRIALAGHPTSIVLLVATFVFAQSAFFTRYPTLPN